MSIICTICARGGSVGVKNKNIRILCGKPLIAHTILQAKASQLFDKIVVSSDSKDIRDIALAWGCDLAIDRPVEMATATAAKMPVIRHAVRYAEEFFNTNYDYIFELDATAPLRAVSDIKNAFSFFIANEKAENLISGCLARTSPYFSMVEKNESGFVTLVKKPSSTVVRRQDAPICYDMSASIYIWKHDALFADNKHVVHDKTILFEIPEERAVDIDTSLDWEWVEFLMQREGAIIGEQK